MNPDLDFLNVIRQAASAAVAHVGDQERLSFEADRKSLSAVLYEIVVIGEGVKRLSPEFRSEHPEVPWKQSPECVTEWSIPLTKSISILFGR
jgi:uncharacterized protein with HEPN domain